MQKFEARLTIIPIYFYIPRTPIYFYDDDRGLNAHIRGDHRRHHDNFQRTRRYETWCLSSSFDSVLSCGVSRARKLAPVTRLQLDTVRIIRSGYARRFNKSCPTKTVECRLVAITLFTTHDEMRQTPDEMQITNVIEKVTI